MYQYNEYILAKRGKSHIENVTKLYFESSREIERNAKPHIIDEAWKQEQGAFDMITWGPSSKGWNLAKGRL